MTSADDDVNNGPHLLNVHSYKTPHFCDYCGDMLWGLVKQGLKCDACGLSFHKRCAHKIPPNDCKYTRHRWISSAGAEDGVVQQQVRQMTAKPSSTGSPSLPKEVDLGGGGGGVAGVAGGHSNLPHEGCSQLQVPHSFVTHNFTRPTTCEHCNRLMPLFRQGFQCSDCKLNCHKKCSESVSNNCQGEAKDVSLLESEFDAMSTADESSAESPQNGSAEDLEKNLQSPEDDGEKTPADRISSGNIPLQRIVQSVKHTKRTGSKVIREGWMVCYTNRDQKRKRHYWKVDSKAITLFFDDKTNRYYKEILLKDIFRVEPYGGSGKFQSHPTNPPLFEIQARETIYYVGEDPGCVRIQPPMDSGIGKELAVYFESAIRQALLPVLSQNGSGPKLDQSEDKVSTEEEIKDISQLYQILPEEILGSGQFGIVYGAVNKAKGHEVAIKVIDKLRFPNKHEAQLKNEVTILQNLCHPGVINLEYMFESADKIYVVMEKLKGDMLEMILSNPNGRLCERLTKFVVSQILISLRHLHSRHVVHCDLKPENVLLSTNNLFPQVKLCDFGFSRVIGEKSFRRSVVGTPAYLAPEVLKNKGYNKSLDMWSVGVILYVSLSGTFPFNEDEDITDQIQNAAFMYPPNPWNLISREAKDLISKVLQVKIGNRFTVEKSLSHVWLQDYQCWCDLRKLEQQVGQRYLTHESDDERWEKHRADKNLPTWEAYGHRLG